MGATKELEGSVRSASIDLSGGSRGLTDAEALFDESQPVEVTLELRFDVDRIEPYGFEFLVDGRDLADRFVKVDAGVWRVDIPGSALDAEFRWRDATSMAELEDPVWARRKAADSDSFDLVERFRVGRATIATTDLKSRAQRAFVALDLASIELSRAFSVPGRDEAVRFLVGELGFSRDLGAVAADGTLEVDQNLEDDLSALGSLLLNRTYQRTRGHGLTTAEDLPRLDRLAGLFAHPFEVEFLGADGLLSPDCQQAIFLFASGQLATSSELASRSRQLDGTPNSALYTSFAEACEVLRKHTSDVARRRRLDQMFRWFVASLEVFESVYAPDERTWMAYRDLQRRDDAPDWCLAEREELGRRFAPRNEAELATYWKATLKRLFRDDRDVT